MPLMRYANVLLMKAEVYNEQGLSLIHIYTGMTHHITIGVVHHDEIELLGLDSCNQLVLHLVRTHFRLQVVSGNLRRRNQDALFSIVGLSLIHI